MASMMNAGTAIQGNPHVEVGFSPTIALISVVRTFVSDFYARVLSSNVREMLVMATHELLENAVKYGIDDRATFRIDVEHRDREDHASIRMQNRSTPDHIEHLRAVLGRIHEHPDRFGHYIALMRETAKREHGSGLGLARISAEAGMDLRLEVDGDLVSIIAHCAVEKRRDS